MKHLPKALNSLYVGEHTLRQHICENGDILPVTIEARSVLISYVWLILLALLSWWEAIAKHILHVIMKLFLTKMFMIESIITYLAEIYCHWQAFARYVIECHCVITIWTRPLMFKYVTDQMFRQWIATYHFILPVSFWNKFVSILVVVILFVWHDT
jgi:hypothetical protein